MSLIQSSFLLASTKFLGPTTDSKACSLNNSFLLVLAPTSLSPMVCVSGLSFCILLDGDFVSYLRGYSPPLSCESSFSTLSSSSSRASSSCELSYFCLSFISSSSIYSTSSLTWICILDLVSSTVTFTLFIILCDFIL